MRKRNLEIMYQRLKDATMEVARQNEAQSYELAQAMTRQTPDTALHKLAEACFVKALSHFNTTRRRSTKQRESVLKLKKQYLVSIVKLASLAREESFAYEILNEIVKWLSPDEVGEIQQPGGLPVATEFILDEEIKKLLG